MPRKQNTNKNRIPFCDSIYQGNPTKHFTTAVFANTEHAAPPPVSKKISDDPEDKNWVERLDPSYASNFKNNPVGDFGFKTGSSGGRSRS
jgi:hypothetical protein